MKSIRRKFAPQNERLFQEDPIDNHSFKDQSQYLVQYLEEYREHQEMMNQRPHGQTHMKVNHREEDDKFVINNAENLNRLSQPASKKIENWEQNFSPNAFPVDPMNVKNILDTCLHNNCT